MRRYVFINIVLIIVFILIMGAYSSCFATNKKKYDITSNEFIKTWDFNATQGNFVNQGTKPITNLIVLIVSKAVGIIQVFTGILMVVCVTFTGFKMIMGTHGKLAGDIGLDIFVSKSDKDPKVRQRLLDNFRRLTIGSIFAFSSSTLVRIAFDIITRF